MEIHIKVTIDDRLVSAARAVSRRLSARRAALVLGLCAMSATLVMAAPVTNPHDFKAGSRIRAAEINESFAVLYDELNARFIRADTTLEVDDCAGLVATLGELDDKRIGAAATVKLELPAGSFDCPTIYVDHVDGHHIHIVGQGSGETTLRFGGDGFVVTPSRALGLLDKLTLAGSRFEGTGVIAWGNATATLGSDLVVRRFVTGVRSDGSYVIADGVTAEANTEIAFHASSGGFMNVNRAVARGSTYGFSAYLGSAMIANTATAEDNSEFGFSANVGSAIRVGVQSVSRNNEHGYDANANSTIEVTDSTASGSTAYGFAAWNDSYIGGSRVMSNDQGLEGFSARHGSYVQVLDPAGNDVSYAPPGLGMFSQTERSMLFELQ